MRRLNIFVDETGEFGFGNGASDIYGVSLTFHEQDNNIKNEINKLNERLNRIGYTNMIHMADLVMRRGDYANFDLKMRKSIFNAIYIFSKRIPVKFYTIIIEKKYINRSTTLRKKLINEINNMIKNHIDYFNKFDKIVMYYDNGQKTLGNILELTFGIFESFEHRIEFDHKEKRLFQVSDMLTYIDKFDYKYKHKLKFTLGEKYFFELSELRKIVRDLSKKRL